MVLDNLLNFNLGSVMNSVVDVASILLILGFLIWIIWAISRVKERHAETEEIKDSGPEIQKVYIEADKEEKATKKEEAKEEATEKEAEKEQEEAMAMEEAAGEKPSKADKQERRVLKKTAKTATAVAQAEEVSTKILKTSIVAVAALQNTTNEIREDVKAAIQIEAVEEREQAQVGALASKIKSAGKFSDINNRAAKYFSQYFQPFGKLLRYQVKMEKQKEEHHYRMAGRVKTSAEHLRLILKEAKSELYRFNKMERKEIKGFKQQFSSLMKEMKLKIKQLKNEKKKGKDANKQLINTLGSEISLFRKNEARLQALEIQIKKTENFLKQQTNGLKKIIKQVLSQERTARKITRRLVKRDHQLKNRVEELEEQQKKIDNIIERFGGSSIMQGLVLAMSSNLEEYTKIYNTMIKADINFENTLKETLISNIFVEKKMLTFVELLKSLEKTEEAVEAGASAATQLAAVVFTDNVRGSLKVLSKEISSNENILNYQEKASNYIAAVIQEMEKETIEAEREVEELIKKEKKIIGENETTNKTEQDHMGRSFATIVKRKEAVDTTYLSKVSNFSKKIKETNRQAHSSYKQALAA